MRGNTAQGWDRIRESRRALQRDWQKGTRRQAARQQATGTVGTLAHLPGPGRGSKRAGRPPHIRVSGDTQLLLLRPPPPPRRRNAKLPATTATPRPSDGSYLRLSWARLRNAPLQPLRAELTCPEDEDGRHAHCVSRSFSPRRGRRGVGARRAGVHPRRRRGGRPRVRAPRVGASRGSGCAP